MIANETDQKAISDENPSNECTAVKAMYFHSLENNLLPLVPSEAKELSSAEFVRTD